MPKRLNQNTARNSNSLTLNLEALYPCLIGGIIAALSLLGLLMVTEPDTDKEKQQQEADK